MIATYTQADSLRQIRRKNRLFDNIYTKYRQIFLKSLCYRPKSIKIYQPGSPAPFAIFYKGKSVRAELEKNGEQGRVLNKLLKTLL